MDVLKNSKTLKFSDGWGWFWLKDEEQRGTTSTSRTNMKPAWTPKSCIRNTCKETHLHVSFSWPSLSTWATAWRCPRGVHTAALCPRCRRRGRIVCPAGTGSRRASGCSSASDPEITSTMWLTEWKREFVTERFSLKGTWAHLLSDQQGGALQGDRHHLVRVPRYRVGPEWDTSTVTCCQF